MDQIETIRSFIENADAFIYLKDEEGRFLMVNHKVAEIAGMDEKELIGKTDRDFVPQEIHDQARAVERHVMETGAPEDYQAEVKFKARNEKVKIIDHKFPVSLKGHAKAIGGIAFEMHGKKKK